MGDLFFMSKLRIITDEATTVTSDVGLNTISHEVGFRQLIKLQHLALSCDQVGKFRQVFIGYRIARDEKIGILKAGYIIGYRDAIVLDSPRFLVCDFLIGRYVADAAGERMYLSFSYEPIEQR